MSELSDLVAHLGDSLHQLFSLVTMAGERFTSNLTASFSTMTIKHWIRLVMIVGTYMLVRPYIIKFSAKYQQKQFEKAHEEDAAAAISPNQLRGQVDIPEDSDDDEVPDPEATAASTSADWGKKARKRQRVMLKKLIDAEEQRLQELQEDEEDKDIEQYLT
ncbi:hypothetical protein PFICI_09523 [Pestalotiopsis fici W106-1]|uniref:Uncharacterized protein n=1 Tax=Pestalotiopsis fici (strain W106-1 / CGMCC3.15140) TaxID=1229662 RepID=W3X0P8_PESFW|nr:uncharacterized protein PFICI_09523 [Pestalotiopsis fici W106-1]ETS79670.1 hypothetical protein PFICI_09523 [Pestalotiopsis fici W106-1]